MSTFGVEPSRGRLSLDLLIYKQHSRVVIETAALDFNGCVVLVEHVDVFGC